jgi:site-specific DNA-methyltransferase (adenine-specific)
MAARVEVAISDYFNVLTRITWAKPKFSTKAEMFDKDAMRSYFPSSEAIVFAEHGNGDELASSEAGYHAEYDEAKRLLRYNILADYLQSEFDRAQVERKEIAALFPSRTGNITGCVSNWLLGYNIPTSEQYHGMRDYLNSKAQSTDYLRREYEDLRRPFNASPYRPYTDVWTYRTVQAYTGKHECEKPLDMMKHIIETSSRPDSVVLDTFAGSGATLDAARQLGRKFIGCDMSQHWTDYATHRLSLPYNVSLLDFSIGSGTTAIAARKTGRRFICGDNSPEYVALTQQRLQTTDPYQDTVLNNGMKQLSFFAMPQTMEIIERQDDGFMMSVKV